MRHCTLKKKLKKNDFDDFTWDFLAVKEPLEEEISFSDVRSAKEKSLLPNTTWNTLWMMLNSDVIYPINSIKRFAVIKPTEHYW